jgi:hypothetical protein
MRAWRGVQGFEPRHVSGVLWALATLRLRPPPALLAALAVRAAQLCRQPGEGEGEDARARRRGSTRGGGGGRGEALRGQSLSLTLWALGRLRFVPRRPELRALLAAAEAEHGETAAGAGAAAGADSPATPA